MSKYILLLLLMSLTSCTLVGHKDRENMAYSGVKVDQKQLPSIEVKDVTPRVETTRDEKKQMPEPHGLFFGPGMYDISLSIGALYYIEKNNININLISGNGLGLIVGFLFALKGKASLVEWEWFKLVNDLKKEKIVYSKGWMNRLQTYLNKNFGKVRFSDLEKAFFIPLYESGQLAIKTSKLVVPYLIRALSILENESRQYQSTMPNMIFPLKYFSELRVEKIFVFNSMPKKVGLKYKNQNIWKVFMQIPLKIEEEAKNISYFISLNKEYSEIDDFSRSLGLVNVGFLQSKKYLESIMKDLKKSRR